MVIEMVFAFVTGAFFGVAGAVLAGWYVKEEK